MFKSSSGFKTKNVFTSKVGFESHSGDTPPPVSDVTFRFPLTDNANDTKSGDTFTHTHTSPQTEIIGGELKTYAPNVPAFSDFGLTARGEDINYHGYSADVTQYMPPGPPNYLSSMWTESIGVIRSFDSLAGIGNLAPNTATGEHKISMARVLGSTLKNPSGRFHVMMEVRPVGWDIPDASYTGLRKIALAANLNDTMVVDIKNGTIDFLQLNGYIQALSDGWIFIYHELDSQGDGAANNANLFLLDDNNNFSWAGDPNKQLEIRSATYSKQPNNANQYSPIVNNTGATLTRLATTGAGAFLSSPVTDRNFTIYCEITNTGLDSISNNQDSFLFLYGNNLATEFWLLGLSRDGAGQLKLVVTNFVTSTEKLLSDWPINETKRISFQVLDSLPVVIDVDGGTGDGLQQVTSFYPNLSRLCLGFGASLIEPYIAIKELKRIEKTGLTLTEAQNEQ
jgi:hypothetical protein